MACGNSEFQGTGLSAGSKPRPFAGLLFAPGVRTQFLSASAAQIFMRCARFCSRMKKRSSARWTAFRGRRALLIFLRGQFFSMDAFLGPAAAGIARPLRGHCFFAAQRLRAAAQRCYAAAQGQETLAASCARCPQGPDFEASWISVAARPLTEACCRFGHCSSSLAAPRVTRCTCVLASIRSARCLKLALECDGRVRGRCRRVGDYVGCARCPSRAAGHKRRRELVQLMKSAGLWTPRLSRSV